MGRVLLRYQTVVVGHDERIYLARACGGSARDGTRRWHGWIEFLPLDGGPPIRTALETTQPDRSATVYWSTGLSLVYLEGALRRALAPIRAQSAAASARTIAWTRKDRRDRSPRMRVEFTPFDRWFLKSLGIAPTMKSGVGRGPGHG